MTVDKAALIVIDAQQESFAPSARYAAVLFTQ